MQVDLIVAMVGQTGIILTLVVGLHWRRQDAAKLERNETKSEHNAVRAAIKDLAETVSNEYVRRTDFNGAMQSLRDGIDRTHDRVDQIFVQMGQRNGTDSRH